jgi:hypothetical protein
MKAHGGMEVQLHSFLTSALDDGEWSISHPSHFTLGESVLSNYWIEGFVGPRGSLNTFEKRRREEKR